MQCMYIVEKVVLSGKLPVLFHRAKIESKVTFSISLLPLPNLQKKKKRRSLTVVRWVSDSALTFFGDLQDSRAIKHAGRAAAGHHL